jgi:hypothetical protein
MITGAFIGNENSTPACAMPWLRVRAARYAGRINGLLRHRETAPW